MRFTIHSLRRSRNNNTIYWINQSNLVKPPSVLLLMGISAILQTRQAKAVARRQNSGDRLGKARKKRGAILSDPRT